MKLWHRFEEMDLTTLLWTCILALMLISVLVQKRNHQKINAFMASIPGPMSIPFIGNGYYLLGVLSNGCYSFLKFRKLYEKYPISGYWHFGRPYVVTSDREICNAILASPQSVDKIYDYDFFKAHSDATFQANGADWRKTRKLMNPSFRTDLIATFNDNFCHHTQDFFKCLEKNANSGKNFDIFVPVHLMTIDFVCHNMMGCQVDAQLKNLRYLSTNMQRSTQTIFNRMFGFLERSDFLFSLLGKDKKLKELVDPLRNFVADILEEQITRRNELRRNGIPKDIPQTFINILLNSIETGVITKEKAHEEMNEMFIAGSITTAISNAWIFKNLAMHPDIQEKVYREIIDTCGHSEITSSDFSRLVYLDMVVKETLRLFGAPIVGREIVEDLKVDEKTTIPAGIGVLLFIHGIHTNSDYWERPGEFYPEHFASSNKARRPEGAYIPFLIGPRFCPGNKYAMQSLKFVVANTMLHYEFSTDEKPPMDWRDSSFRFMFMACPLNGFCVQIKRRSHNPHHWS